MTNKNNEQNLNKNGLPSCNINWFPGHMSKTKKQISEMLPIIDIVFEIIDARIPYSSKIVDINNLIKNKPRILIMSKADLCDINITNRWVKKYEKDGYKVVLANLENNSDINKIINATKEIEDEINNKRREKGLKEKELKSLVVGIPNVGKSTFINKLAGKKVAVVGNKPGVTTNLTWLKTKLNLVILDTPGILWPKFESSEVSLNLSACSAIKESVLPADEVCIHILNKLDKYYKDILKTRYNIESVNIDDIEETYIAIGKKIGALVRGGEIDYDRVSIQVINDVRQENIKGITFDRIDD